MGSAEFNPGFINLTINLEDGKLIHCEDTILQPEIDTELFAKAGDRITLYIPRQGMTVFKGAEVEIISKICIRFIKTQM